MPFKRTSFLVSLKWLTGLTLSHSSQISLTANRSRMDYIDALRGMACLSVVLHHSLTGQPVAPGLAHLPLRALVYVAEMGGIGVSLFLVLSGFCLFYSLVRDTDITTVRPDWRAFAKRRAIRILPPYYAALGFCILFIVAANYVKHRPLDHNFSGWADIPAHLLMVHNLSPNTLGSINAYLWSLGLESQLYVVFPLLVMLTARRGVKALLGVTLMVALVWQLGVFSHFGFRYYWTSTLATWYHALPARCFEFALGMAAAFYVAHPPKGLLRFCKIAAPLLLACSLWYVLHSIRYGPLVDSLWGGIFFCTLILLNQVPAERFRINRILRFFTWAGTISYSLYLTHNFVLWCLRMPEGSDSAVYLVLFFRIVAALGVGYLFFWCFERPFLANRKKGAPAPVEVATTSSATRATRFTSTLS